MKVSVIIINVTLIRGVFKCFRGTLVERSNRSATIITQKLSSKSRIIRAIKLIEKTIANFDKGFNLWNGDFLGK